MANNNTSASRIEMLTEKEENLRRTTGHELLKPANQYCKHCGNAMFVKELSRKKCTNNIIN